jgi:Uncharacterized conserved protein (DUF2278)
MAKWIQAGGRLTTKFGSKPNQDYCIAVNVLSVDDSEVLAFFDSNFTAATKLDLATRANGPAGFTALRIGPDGQGLDYLRDNLFSIDKMAAIPPDGAGVTLANLLDAQTITMNMKTLDRLFRS